jgi:hypothetical protein
MGKREFFPDIKSGGRNSFVHIVHMYTFFQEVFQGKENIILGKDPGNGWQCVQCVYFGHSGARSQSIYSIEHIDVIPVERQCTRFY